MKMPTRPIPPGTPRITPIIRPTRTYKEVLDFAGFPSEVVTLDFETFFCESSGYSLRELTVPEYIASKDFEVLGLASKIDDDPAVFHQGEGAAAHFLESIRFVWGENLDRITVAIHNASFDAQILAMRYGLHPKYLIDTVGLSRAWNSRRKNGLKELCETYNLPAKGETSNFDGLSHRPRFRRSRPGLKRRKPPTLVPVMTPQQASELASYAINDVERQAELLPILLPKLCKPELELRVCQHAIEMATKPTLLIDPVKAADITTRMAARMTTAIEATGRTAEELSGDISFDRLMTSALECAGDQPGKYYKVMKRGMQLAIAKTDPERALLENHSSDRVRRLMAGRQAQTTWPNHIGRVNALVATAKALGGKLAVPLKYAGAHTMRYSGADGLNLQNLGARGDALISEVREIITAPPGHKLVIVDLAGIEARVLAWVARQDDLVTAFRDGADIYSSFASVFYGVPVRKPNKTGIPAIEQRMKDRRAFGKVVILGSGYGMGPDRFHEYAGCDIATAESAIKTYRETYAAIPQFWKDIEMAFIFTAKYHRSCVMPLGLRFDHLSDCDVQIVLPSGHTLQYPRVKLELDRFGRNETASVYNELTHIHDHLWGGVLTENVVQSISRHILVESMMRLEDQGIHTALSVHDELVIVAPTEKADGVLATTIKEMTVTPTWAPGLPLAAEGSIGDRYGK